MATNPSVRAIRLIQCRYTAQLLNYFLENNASEFGDFTKECIARAPQVHPEFQERYFEFFNPLIGLLHRYAELEIQSAYSCAYLENRQRQCFAIHGWLTEFETDRKYKEAVRALWTAVPEIPEEVEPDRNNNIVG